MYTVQHLALVVRDLEATRDFFVDNFDYVADDPVTWSGPQIDELAQLKDCSVTFVHLKPCGADANTTTVAVQRYNNPEPPRDDTAPILNLIGYRHIGFMVDDIDAMYEKLSANWKFFSKPVHISNAKLQTVYFYGPEGIVVQLMQMDATT